METNEIKQFLSVARHESIHRASEEMGVSPGSLSKAVKKLENEFQVQFFERQGRNIKLTEYGHYFKKKALEFLHLEDSIKTEVLGTKNAFEARLAGEEILLSYFGVKTASQVKNAYPNAKIEFIPLGSRELFSKIRDREVSIGLTTYNPPTEFDYKMISTIEFRTFISSKHPLYKQYNKHKSIHIHDILKYSFVIPNTNFLGRIHKSDSTDGWRDDQLPRKIAYTTSSIKTIESLVQRGEAIAYLPEYFSEDKNMLNIHMEGCPYTCKQKVYLITKNKNEAGWIRSLF